MSTISAYDSSSISTLFSSLNTSSSSSSSSDLLNISYSDYATITNGSYYKLMKAYYEDGTTIGSTSTTKDSSTTLAQIESAAENMSESADALLATGSKSLFNKVSKTDTDGNTTTGYDTDAIYKAVKEFADNYNDLLDEAADSNTTNILSTAKSLTTYTAQNKSLLSSIGITVGSDNKLTVDETAFKSADMTVVKSLFNSTGSFGYQVSAKASVINYYAQNEASKSNTYSSSGSYTYNYSTGTIYSSET